MSIEHRQMGGLTVAHAAGEGPKMVFVHGASAGSWNWETFLDWFSGKGYDCYAVNLRGHAPNPALDDLGTVTTLDYVADVNALLDELGEPVILVGHSMGGVVAQVVAAKRQVKALVLASTGPVSGVKFKHPPFNIWFVLHVIKSIPAMIRKKALKPGRKVLLKSVLNRMDPAGQAKYLPLFVPESGAVGVEVLKGEVAGDVSHADIPKLVISGDQDKTSVIEMQREIAEQQRADLIELPGHGHMFMIEPGWEDCAERLYKWLREKL